MSPVSRAALPVAFALAATGLRWVAFPESPSLDLQAQAQGFQSPGPELMSAFSLNHAPAAADLTWLRTIQYIGSGSEAAFSAKAEVLRSFAELATDLDPRYFTVYWSVAIILSAYARSAEDSNALCRKGLKALGPHWELYAIQAYNAFFIERDNLKASRLYAKAAQIPGAPRFLSSLAGRARTLATGPDDAIAMLRELLPTLPPGPQREDALDRIRLAKREKLLMAWDEACEAFRRAEGRLPRTPEEIVARGFAELPLEDSFGKPIELGIHQGAGERRGRCVARTSEVPRRDFEVLEDLEIEGAPGLETTID
jgi:hypothetical protein